MHRRVGAARFGHWTFGIWNLFGIWCLEFGISAFWAGRAPPNAILPLVVESLVF